jgi:uncharacterized protein DUF4184
VFPDEGVGEATRVLVKPGLARTTPYDAHMPFTVSHLAAVAPIARRPLSVPALVCGAMAPDLPYYLNLLALPVSATLTHSLLGILVADVPLALAMLAVYYGLLARPLTALVPARHRHLVPAAGMARQGERPVKVKVKLLATVVVSAVIGALTHIVWDAFTHPSGTMVQAIDALRAPAFGRLRVYQLLQHASSLIGMAVTVAWWLRSRQPAMSPGPEPLPPGPEPLARLQQLERLGTAGRGLVIGGLSGGVLLGSAVRLITARATEGSLGAGRTVFHTLTGGIGGALAAAMLLAVAWHAHKVHARRRTRRAAS